MRWDRFITMALVRPLQRLTRNGRPDAAPAAVPILMYHALSDDPELGVAPYYQVHTRPAVFREHLQFLADHGYQSLTLDQALAHLSAGAPSAGPRPVVLTFDDGFRDFYTEAFPALQQHGFTATMFLPTASIGNTRKRFLDRECLTWAEVRELAQAGLQFGSHTVNHPKLVERSWPEIHAELAQSKTEIEQQLGRPVTDFCYPYAFPQCRRLFVARFRDLVRETGYARCVTTQLGRVRAGDDPYQLKRLPVNSRDDMALLQAKLEGGYDWLARPQAVVKRVKAFRAHRSTPAGASAAPTPPNP
jgi:peptidoglycan/xylan/chitin deacetylase (PgdA/CDA1 family)